MTKSASFIEYLKDIKILYYNNQEKFALPPLNLNPTKNDYKTISKKKTQDLRNSNFQYFLSMLNKTQTNHRKELNNE
jgi:hypothetical protein